MISCIFVGGGFSYIGDREYDTVGQRAMLSEEGFKEAVLGNAAFIPEEDYRKIGFTATELSLYSQSGARFNPPHEFTEKLELAQSIYRDLRNRMLSESNKVLADASA